MTEEKVDIEADPERVIPIEGAGYGVVAITPEPNLFSRLGAWAKDFFHPITGLFEARSFWLMPVAFGLLWLWDAAWVKTVIQFAMSGVAIIGMAHWVRKVLAPDVDIQAAANKAMEHWAGAAIIYAISIIFVLVSMVYLSSAGSIKP
jgi:hypothetical protein